MTGSVTVVVLNWNGGDLVHASVRAALAQDYPDCDVLVVDNGSTDGSLDGLRTAFPAVSFVPLPTNTGFAGGMNTGIRAARGDMVLLLNLDCELAPDYVSRCVEMLQSDPQMGGVTGKLLKTSDGAPVIDSAGHVVYRNRRAVDRGEGEPDTGQYDAPQRLFSVCAAAVLLRREMLDDVADDGEFFDEDFFAYFEDFDLCWRAELRGWHFGYQPRAVGRHQRGGSGGRGSSFILACNHRNRLLTMVKNDAGPAWRRHAVGIVYTELRATVHMLGVRPIVVPMAWWQLLRLLPRAVRKRRRIQARRRVGWQQLEPCFEPYDYTMVFRRIWHERRIAR